MFQRILVAIDESEANHDVFQEAIRLAQLTRATLNLLHVLTFQEKTSPQIPMVGQSIYPVETDVEISSYQEQWHTYEREGSDLIKRYMQEAIAAGVSAKSSQFFGNPGQTICSTARHWNADLVMIGRREHSKLSEFIRESVSNYVFHHAPCSVLVVRSHNQIVSI